LLSQLRRTEISYYAAFACVVELQGPIDNYVEHKLDENYPKKAVARCVRRSDAREKAVSVLLSYMGADLRPDNTKDIRKYLCYNLLSFELFTSKTKGTRPIRA
jgi:hypothetical protein